MERKKVLSGSRERSQIAQVEGFHPRILALRVRAKIRRVVAERDQFFVREQERAPKGEFRRWIEENVAGTIGSIQRSLFARSVRT